MLIRRLALLCAYCLAAPALAASNLLAAGHGQLVVGSHDRAEAAVYAALTDADRGRPAGVYGPIAEFVVAFDETVTAEAVVIHLTGNGRGADAATVEVLASIATEDAGFRLLRAGTVDGSRERWSFDFLPAGARWLMLRVTPGKAAAPPPISEIEILGAVGAPSSRYAFQESPADAARVLKTLRDALGLSVSPAERALLDDAADGRLDAHSSAEAALLASGVADAARRDRLVGHIDRLEGAARVALAGEARPFARGRRLLEWMHATILSGGYDAGQTDVSSVLETGRYNCVSSALLYALLGTRLGLDVRGIEVPDHALAIVYDGSRAADVETTTLRGFDPARDRAALAAFTERTGFAYIPGTHAGKRRETSLLGLVALTYYNHGVEANRAGRYEAALRSYYRALRLDPGLDSAVKNSLATLGRWAGARAETGDFEGALALIGSGLLLAPDDRSLLHNRRVVWQRRIDAAIATGTFEDALAVTRAAHAADPAAGFDRQEARAAMVRARLLADDRRWPQALAVATEAVGRVGPASAQALDRFRANLLLAWMNDAIDGRRWDDALEAAAAGQRDLSDDARVRRNAAYLLQEWSEAVFATQGARAAVSVVERVRARLDGNADVRRAASDFVMRRVGELQRAGRLDEAVEAVAGYAALLDDAGKADRLVTAIHDARAAELIEARRWREAAEVYGKGRTVLPGGSGNRSYQRNLAYIGQEWLKDAGDARDAVATELVARYVDVEAMPEVIGAAYVQAVRRLQGQGGYEQALRVARAGARVLDEKGRARELVRIAYDQWAAQYAKRGQWRQAVDVYAAAMAERPQDDHLKQNARASWHGWARQHMDRQEWAEAIAIYERALDQFPGTRAFEQNIRYCRQEMAKGR